MCRAYFPQGKLIPLFLFDSFQFISIVFYPRQQFHTKTIHVQTWMRFHATLSNSLCSQNTSMCLKEWLQLAGLSGGSGGPKGCPAPQLRVCPGSQGPGGEWGAVGWGDGSSSHGVWRWEGGMPELNHWMCIIYHRDLSWWSWQGWNICVCVGVCGCVWVCVVVCVCVCLHVMAVYDDVMNVNANRL